MKKAFICFGLVFVLAGCGFTTNVKKTTIEQTQMIKNGNGILGKEETIPLQYNNGVFSLWTISIGQGEKEIENSLGKPVKTTAVTDFWRYDKIESFQKNKIQLDIATFRGQIDEITATIPPNRNINLDNFKKMFNGTVYQATQEGLQGEKGIKEIEYYVTPDEDKMLIIKKKDDNGIIISYTYSYDLQTLKDKSEIEVVKK